MGEEVVPATPLSLRFGRGDPVRGDLGVHLVGELGVVGQSGIHLGSAETEQIGGTTDTLSRRDIATDDPVDYLPEVRSTDQRRPPSAGAVAERDEGVVPLTETLVDQLLGQCRVGAAPSR